MFNFYGIVCTYYMLVYEIMFTSPNNGNTDVKISYCHNTSVEYWHKLGNLYFDIYAINYVLFPFRFLRNEYTMKTSSVYFIRSCVSMYWKMTCLQSTRFNPFFFYFVRRLKFLTRVWHISRALIITNGWKKTLLSFRINRCWKNAIRTFPPDETTRARESSSETHPAFR